MIDLGENPCLVCRKSGKLCLRCQRRQLEATLNKSPLELVCSRQASGKKTGTCLHAVGITRVVVPRSISEAGVPIHPDLTDLTEDEDGEDEDDEDEDDEDENDIGWDTESMGMEYESSSDHWHWYGAVGRRKTSRKSLYPPPYPHLLPQEPRYMREIWIHLSGQGPWYEYFWEWQPSEMFPGGNLRGLFLVTYATQHSPRRVVPSPLHVAIFQWTRGYAQLAAARMYAVARGTLGMDPTELD